MTGSSIGSIMNYELFFICLRIALSVVAFPKGAN